MKNVLFNVIRCITESMYTNNDFIHEIFVYGNNSDSVS